MDWSIAEIAYALGFEYPAYFNNYFKRMTGTVPSHWERDIFEVKEKCQSVFNVDADYCAGHKIYPQIQIITAEKINEACEKVINKEARYRYVIDTATI